MSNRSLKFVRALVVFALLCPAFAQDNPESQVRKIIERFEQGLKNRDLKSIESVVAPDIVVLENGHRNDGWADFRDNHLVPELKEPAAPSKTEVIRIKAGPEMGWGHTRTETTITRKTGDEVTLLVWSAYFVEKRDGVWKIAFLDWSVRALKPGEMEAPAIPRVIESGGASWNLEMLEKRFKDAGLKVRRDVKVRQPFLTATGRVLVLGDGEAEIQVYIYRDAKSRVHDTDKLDSVRVAPPTMQVSWLMPASLITHENLAAIVLTRDETLRARISEVIRVTR